MASRLRSWRAQFRNAFALNDAARCTPSAEDRAMLEKLAAELARRRLTGPALTFLEMSRPLNVLGSAALHFFTPLASTLADPVALKRFAEFLEQRGSVELLIAIVEEAERAQVSKPPDPRDP